MRGRYFGPAILSSRRTNSYGGFESCPVRTISVCASCAAASLQRRRTRHCANRRGRAGAGLGRRLFPRSTPWFEGLRRQLATPERGQARLRPRQRLPAQRQHRAGTHDHLERHRAPPLSRPMSQRERRRDQVGRWAVRVMPGSAHDFPCKTATGVACSADENGLVTFWSRRSDGRRGCVGGYRGAFRMSSAADAG